MKKIIIGFLVLMMCFFVSCKKSDEIPNTPIPPTPQKHLPIIVSFTADKTTVAVNETTYLRWTVTDALKLELSRNGSSMGEVNLVGSIKINPTQYGQKWNVYRLDATNTDGSVYGEVQVIVNYPDVEYRVSGSTNSVFITYANKDEGTSQTYAQTPWTYKFSGAKSGQFLYVSAQNQRSSGSVKVEIYKNGDLYKVSESSGAYVIATASGSY
ncbi:MAG: hypothetical protein MUO31_09450 [Thermodesulfovibrionales bacterium]|nr:hypothetical protein [Thermodesulfovibrionales bacterium]